MPRRLFAMTLGAALAAFGSPPSPALADEAQVARGRYLVIIAGCSDCHTPGALIGAPDMKRYLGGIGHRLLDSRPRRVRRRRT